MSKLPLFRKLFETRKWITGNVKQHQATVY